VESKGLKGLFIALFVSLFLPAIAHAQGGAALARFKAGLPLVTQPYVNSNRRADAELQDYIYRYEQVWTPFMSLQEKQAFQKIVGVLGGKIRGEKVLPELGTSYWLKYPTRLHSYRSRPEIVREVDYLGIGAGLAATGGMPEILKYANSHGETVMWLDAQGVGEGASGQNGGNFATWSERFNGVTADGFPLDGQSQGLDIERYIFLKRAYPFLPEDELRKLAHESAVLQMTDGVANAELIFDRIAEMGIDADQTQGGWFRFADSAEDERHIQREMELARSLGIQTEWWTALRIQLEFGVPARYGGRLIKGFGNYHPYKFVNGVFEWGLKNNLLLFTQVRVLGIDTNVLDSEPVVVLTSEGPVRVRKGVLVYTDAYTDFIPSVKNIVQPFQSRILTYNHVINRYQGMSMTRHAGDWYANGPRGTWYVDENGQPRMMLLIGGGPDTPAPDPWNLVLNPEHAQVILRQVGETFTDLAHQPPASMWQGPFGFSPDGMSIVDELQGPRVVGSILSDGYGGTRSPLLGMVAAQHFTKSPEELARILEKYAPRRHNGLKRFDKTRFCAGLVYSQKSGLILPARFNQ
jgi:glycine/D-amino acid oxidase-like deaminating enzyme